MCAQSQDAFEALETIGDALQMAAAGVTWRSNIEKAWGEPRAEHAQALYAIWQNPLMVAGHDTYIHAAMNWWGIGNAAPTKAEGTLSRIERRVLGCTGRHPHPARLGALPFCIETLRAIR